MNGGEIVARVLQAHGVKFLFTLCGGHISPILSASKQRGVRVIDMRHEVNAVFAADAVARLSGVPGVAAVTAGPGVTNTITAVKNAALAQSPLVLLGGATATVLRGRGSLQDIDQMRLMRPNVKAVFAAKRVRDIAPLLYNAFAAAQSGVPGPVFVEVPVDLLYDESTVRGWYQSKAGANKSVGQRVQNAALGWHLGRLFKHSEPAAFPLGPAPRYPGVSDGDVERVARLVEKSQRPVLLLGSQSLARPDQAAAVASAVEQLGVPVYLGGMARGLLGPAHALQLRHKRREALRQADLVLLAGLACDFRLDYGRHIGRGVTHIAVNRSRADLKLNKRPTVAVHSDPGDFLIALARNMAERPAAGPWGLPRRPPGRLTADRTTHINELRARDAEREAEIAREAAQVGEHNNPLHALREIDHMLEDHTILVADGGDFVGTAAYTLRARQPLGWLDPGLFGTLGVGAGFAIGAKLCRPESEVWIIYGDGSCGYSIAEFDTCVRHGIPVVALVGNDACWAQIAREQIEVLRDDVGVMLRRTDYDVVARGLGGDGCAVRKPHELSAAVQAARQAVAEGKPYLINLWLDRSEFRKGSISI